MKMAPTKADPLYERMLYAFGHEDIERQLMVMLTFDCLTDEAQKELLRRCIRSHKRRRKYAAESRRLSRFTRLAHTPGRIAAPPFERTDEFPYTLDLRTPRS